MVSSRGLGDVYKRQPLLSAVARLSPDEASLSPDAARERLSALGYRDPAGALRHLEVLTEGMSRAASIQRQLLPVMLEWFAEMADPDAGLLAFRKVSEELGTTHWYLRLLRDEGEAAQILAHLSLIHISEPTRRHHVSRMPSSA